MIVIAVTFSGKHSLCSELNFVVQLVDKITADDGEYMRGVDRLIGLQYAAQWEDLVGGGARELLLQEKLFIDIEGGNKID